MPRCDVLRRGCDIDQPTDVSTGAVVIFTRTGTTWAQQALFFGPIAMGRDELGAMFCCGTNVLFRRAALDNGLSASLAIGLTATAALLLRCIQDLAANPGGPKFARSRRAQVTPAAGRPE